MAVTKKTTPKKTVAKKAPESVAPSESNKASEPAKTPDQKEPVKTSGMGYSSEEDVEIFCAFRRNIQTVVVNERTQRTSRVDMGGFRYGVLSGDRQAIYYNKKTTNQVDAIWFARLKAVECAKEWFPNLKHLTVKDEFGEVKVTNRASNASRYAWVANKHATDRGFSVEYLTIPHTENKAKSVAAVENGPQHYTEEQRQAFLSAKQSQAAGGPALPPLDEEASLDEQENDARGIRQ